MTLLNDPRFAGLHGDELTAALLAHIPTFTAAERAELKTQLCAERARRQRETLHDLIALINVDELDRLYTAAAEAFPDLFPDLQPRKDD